MTPPDKSGFAHKQNAETALIQEQVRLRRFIRNWGLRPLAAFVVIKAVGALLMLGLNLSILLAG